MPRTSLRLKIVLLLLVAVLAAPWALSAGPPHGPQPATPGAGAGPDLLHHLWGLLTSAWSEIGCHIDPNGGCIQVQLADEGCHIDPDGCARSAAAPPAGDLADTGCHIDPNGCAR